MKNYTKFIISTGITFFIFSPIGCSSTKLNYHRGWIGGKYLEANTSFIKKVSRNYFKDNTGIVPGLPDKVKKKQSGAILVSQIYEGTPIAASGIKEGDLILKINDKVVDNIKTLRNIVDNIKPGTEVIFTVYRKDEVLNYPVIVGSESYQKWHTFSLGFGFGGEFDLIPNPDFSIFSIISYKNNVNRLELNSSEFEYFKNIDSLSQKQLAKNQEASYEGWNAWFVFFGFGGKKVILTQEIINKNKSF